MDDLAARFLAPGSMTAVDAERSATVSDDPAGVAQVLHGLLVHEFLGALYGIDVTPSGDEVNLHRARDILAAAGPAPWGETRAPGERVPANCRQFSVCATALLRAGGVPARARCGFSDYFATGFLEDHWVVEVWDGDGRWRLVDAQVDDVQRTALGIDVDVLDVPRDRFVVAGDAWLGHRSGTIDADRCGLSVIGEAGDWWIAGNLLRDVHALLGVETRPWDVWGAMREPEADPFPPADLDLFDRLATLTVGGTIGGVPSVADLDALAEIATTDPRVRLPDQVFNANRHRLEPLPR